MNPQVTSIEIASRIRSTCTHNERGLVARKAVSCRSIEPLSNASVNIPKFGGYHPIAQRDQLHMVPCRRDADCERLCGMHSETKLYYVCQRRYQLYDYMESNPNGEPYWNNITGPLGAVTYAPYDPSTGVFTHEKEPMDGICMDYRLDFQYSCGNKEMALVSQAATQCADNWYVEFYCTPRFAPFQPCVPLTRSLLSAQSVAFRQRDRVVTLRPSQSTGSVWSSFLGTSPTSTRAGIPRTVWIYAKTYATRALLPTRAQYVLRTALSSPPGY